MEKEVRWSTLGRSDGKTPKDLCDQLFSALAEACKIQFLSFVDSNFLSAENAEKVKNVIFVEVDSCVSDYRFVQGSMERKMASGAFSFRTFNILMRNHNVFEINDLLIVDSEKYYIELDKHGKPILDGEGKLNGRSLRRFLIEEIPFNRAVHNPDLDWVGFINSLDQEVTDLYPN